MRSISQWLCTVSMIMGLSSLAVAQERGPGPSSDEIVRALTCKPGQDCEAPPPSTGQRRGFTPGKRSFEIVPKGEAPSRETVEQKAKGGALPTLDVQVTFDFDSDVVGPAAQKSLAALGAAMRDPQLASSRFTLIGHTDGVGARGYNQALSERRALQVRRFLVDVFAIAADRLEAYGRGMTQLKLPGNPSAAENRRVQIINQGQVVGGR